MRASFADAAIGDDLVLPIYAFRAIKLLQLIGILERAVFVGRLRPGHIGGGGNMPGALRRFVHARRRNDLAREFVDRAHVNEMTAIAILDDGEDVFLSGADRFVGTCGVITCRGDLGRLGRERALLF